MFRSLVLAVAAAFVLTSSNVFGEESASVDKAIKVKFAVTPTGAQLPEGWWLSDGRLIKVGEKLEQCGDASLMAEQHEGMAVWQVVTLVVITGVLVGATVAVTMPPKAQQ